MKAIGLGLKFVHLGKPMVPVLANQFHAALTIAIGFLFFPEGFSVAGVFRSSV